MAATLKVKSINKMDVQADNTTVLDVEIDILENGETLETRHLNFPLTSTKDEIQSGLQSFINTFNSDRELAKKNAELDAANAQADQTIAELTGAELEPQAEEATPAETETEVTTEPQGETAAAVEPAQPETPTDQPTETT